ncbi:biliverdin-producing heme oxygenase [Mucilaginibacter ginsenosidivorax]|uniref:Biliverdin-producing heme oxygenase n=1 Tax=Mucilaginibacter ginsenosidivorax TaxID=862126 RepID=A0A5B8VYH8_9SPHI|nr:biliverdin-producing heme oxygenase [Mucilaginibacter ginsenosidivorax]QEC76403.1 biliverdin-producing heme oxygenase [Mucilaginibacter ginsenosidivorax]
MLHETLKQATRQQHNQLEQLMFVDQIMNGTLTFDEYQKILTTNYLTHAHIEEALYTHLSVHLRQRLNFEERIKLPALLQDLEEAHITIPQTEPDTSFIDTSSDAAILGSMYVMEGATLGGNVIVKRLKNNPQLAPYQLNYHYYQVYGDKLVENWKHFIQVLDTIIPANEYPAAVKSAIGMFEYIASLQGWPA